MISNRVPRKLCKYEVRWTTQFIQRMFMHTVGLRRTCPLQAVTGKTPDISEYLIFFYDHVSYKYNSGLGMMAIGRWRVVSHRFGGIISYGIMIQKGTVISRTTVQRLTSLEKDTNKIMASVSEFETYISRHFKEEEYPTYDGSKPNPEEWSYYLEYELEF